MRNNDLNLDSRFDFALSKLVELKKKKPSIKTVFDIGSGNEQLKSKIESLGLTYSSFDLFPPNESVRKWNIEEEFPYEGKADVIIFLEVIEHLNNPWLSVKNIVSILNEGGFLILSTPNPSWSGSRLHLLSSGVLGMFTEEDLKLNHHVFTAWQHIVAFLLKDNGMPFVEFYNLGKKTSIRAYPFWGIKLPGRILFRLTKKAIEFFDKKAVGALYGVVAQKAPANEN